MRSLLVFVIGVLFGVSGALVALPTPASLVALALTAPARSDDDTAGTCRTARLDQGAPPGPLVANAAAGAAVVPLEESRGVWIVSVLLNGAQPARFLLDTGSSVTLLSPRIAAKLPGGLPSTDPVELQTITGLTTGPSARLGSLAIGDTVLRDVPVVLHDPGPGIDGILGNTVLSRYRLTLDADRKLLPLASAR